jgi:SAM-dependent methyltransferase
MIKSAPFDAETVTRTTRRRRMSGVPAAPCPVARSLDCRRRQEAVLHHYRKCPLPDRERPRYFQRRIIDRLRTMVLPGSRVLDIGCGPGDLLAGLEPSVGVGIDFDTRIVECARKRFPRLRFLNLAAEDLHAIGDTFDYVIVSHVLGEIYDLQSLFRAIHTVSHFRTRLIVVHYNRLWQPALFLAEALGLKHPDPAQNNWIPSDELMNLLRLCEFEPVRRFGMTPLPVRVPAASEVFNRYIGNLPLINHLGLNYVVVARPCRPAPPTSRPPSVSIVIPARNEAGHIRSLLQRIPLMAPRQQIIFVEGGSEDATWKTIRQAADEYRGPHEVLCLRQPGRGKADAVRTGFAAATGDILMILDADISVPPEELPAFYRALVNNHGELINGSRMVYPMDRRAMRFLNLLGNRLFGHLFTFLISQRFRDTLCGTKALTRTDYEQIARGRSYFGDFDPFGDFDLLFGAARLNFKIVDVPVHYKARTYGETNISRFRHGLLLFRMCAVAAAKLRFI